MLLLQRSQTVAAYRGVWNGVAGFIDELKPIQEKVLEELAEEIGIQSDHIADIAFSTPYAFYDVDIERTWLIQPVRVDVTKAISIQLNAEHTDYRWIDPSAISQFQTVPNLDTSVAAVLS